MSTRSMAARLKRLEFRLEPGFKAPKIQIGLVDSKGRVLYKMLLGQHGHEYFSPDDRPITKEEANQLSAASEKAEPF